MTTFALINQLHTKGIELWEENGQLKLKAPKGAITEEIRQQLVSNKPDIIAFLKAVSNAEKLPAIKPVVRESTSAELPLSFAQQRLWFIDNLQGGSAEYNMPLAFDLVGKLNVPLVRDVFNAIIARHEVLRTVYVTQDGETRQKIRPFDDVDFDIEIADLSHLTGEMLNVQLNALLDAQSTKPFNLSEDLMLRVTYIKKTANSGVLLFNMHHIASDGWSLEVLTKEFLALYRAFSQGDETPLSPLAVQYADYAQWQREYLEGEMLEAQLDYWQKQLCDVPVLHSITLDYARPKVKTNQGAVVTGRLAAPVASRLNAVAKFHQLTPFMLLHGALALLLSRHSNSNDIVIGTPVANRLQVEVEPLIGFFVNSLVLRVDTCHATLSDYFDHIRQVHTDAQSNQDVPFEQLVERLQVPRSTAHSPLFQIVLTTNSDFGQRDNSEAFELPGLQIQPSTSDLVQSKFDLSVNLSLSDTGVELRWTYDVSLFKQQHIEQFNAHLCRLLTGLSECLETPQKAPQTLPLLSPEEIHYQVHKLNEKRSNYPSNKCIHELFQLQALANPDKVAVVHRANSLTYRQLNEKANQLARFLRDNHEITPDTLIGLCIDRCANMMIAILGILKAGAAYVPLDPSYPESRLHYLLQDAALNLVLSHTSIQSVLQTFNGTVIPLDGLDGIESHFCSEYAIDDLTADTVGISPSNLAYVIYTSGSTGKPKGVMTEHISVARLVKNASFMCLDEHTVMLQSANIAFDATTLEIWGPLLNGGQCILYPHQYLETNQLNDVIEQYQVNALWLTAGLFSEWSHGVHGCNSLKYLLAGGDTLDPEAIARVQQQLPQLTLINGYGPTENTTFSTTYTFEKPHKLDIVPIGKPLDSDVAYILDCAAQLVPQGCIGELCVGGDGLARGYLNRPELTQERFVTNPFFDELDSDTPQLLYRTGDLVRYLPDGNLAFLGRADNQVKIRGFRIELGEIEAQLASFEEVDSALVMVKESADSKQLVGYIKTIQTTEQSDLVAFIAHIKSLLAEQLPDYMVPGNILLVDEWPLTANGKVDRKALPQPDGSCLMNNYVAPENDIERILVRVWGQLLNIEAESISSSANFFELGGHSLLAIRLVAEIRTHCEIEISVQNIFETATLKSLAEVITKAGNTLMRPVPKPFKRLSDKLPMSFAQQRLWFIDSLQGQSAEYNMPLVFEVAGQLDLTLLQNVFATIVTRHEVLRTVYVVEQGEPLQYVRPVSDAVLEIEVKDVCDLTGEILQTRLQDLVQTEVTRPFNLTKDLMLRVTYIKQAADCGVMILNMHHIASDGWSLSVLTEEFLALYEAYQQGQPDPLPVLELQYADFAQWQREYLAGEVLDCQLNYWQKQLDELPAVHSLALDYERPKSKLHRGKLVTGELPTSVANRLQAIAKQHTLTPFMLLHAAFALLLSRHGNSCDIAIGTPVANRLHTELEPLLGFFVNTLVLRVDTSHQTLAHYFEHVRQTHLEAQSNQDVPFEQLVERLNVPRSTAHSPLFQTMMTTNSDFGDKPLSQSSSLVLPSIEIKSFQSQQVQTKFDLNLDVNFGEAGIQLSWIYDVSLFAEQRITQLNEHLCRLLTGLSTIRDMKSHAPHKLPLFSEEEIQYLIHEYNNTEQAFAKDSCIHRLFEQQAGVTPNNVALVMDDFSMTYQQVNEKANQVARYLMAKHRITPDTLVGVCCHRSPEMVIAILGILKAGGAYVPLDPTYPRERLSFMLEDASLTVVLSQSGVQFVLSEYAGNVVALDGLVNSTDHSFYLYATDNISHDENGLTASNLAYVIYTSGSTGKPKGVELTHRSVLNYLTNTQNYLTPDIVFSALSTSLNFDATVTSLFAAWLKGGYLSLVSEDEDVFVALKRMLTQHQAGLFKVTPAHLQGLVFESPILTPHVVVVGGEAFGIELAEKITKQLPNTRFINEYGPTEATVGCSYECFTSATLERYRKLPSIHIGKPILNTQFYVLDAQQQLLPREAIGELYIGGEGLAKGYLNREELTDERFISNPWYQAKVPGSSPRLYKTGDLVRYLPDGNLVFLGRIDDQVKIRGFRVEPGEVEAKLAQLASLDSALVLDSEIAGSKQLVGYVKPKEQLSEDGISGFVADIKSQLLQQLPEYMVPGFIVVVAAWPLTPNGKIDRKALPEPVGNIHKGEFVPPHSEIEQTLADIWAGLLKLDVAAISATANFFESGGHSLLSMRLVAEIRQRCNVELSIHTIFEAPTLQAMAALIEQGAASVVRPPVEALIRNSNTLPVSFAQQRLWFIDNLQGGSPEYNMPLALEVAGQLDLQLVNRVFTTIIERHEILRTVYVVDNGETFQRILPSSDVRFEITVEDLSHYHAEALASQLKERVEAQAGYTFNLAEDLMLRVTWVQTTATSGVMLLNLHHIASDGWSMEVLTQEFLTLYNAYHQGATNPLVPMEIQYADYAHWQRTYLVGENLESQLHYWETQLDELPATHSLPLDFVRPDMKQHKGAVVAGRLPASIAHGLSGIAKQHKLTPFMFLHGALSLVLSRHSNSSDIVIGTPVANRVQAELEPLIGFFVNTLVLRANTRHDSLSAYLAHIRQVHLDAQSNQDVPFEQLVERLKVPRSKAHSPLFQIMMTINTDYGLSNGSSSFSLPEMEIKPYRSGAVQAKFDLKVDLNIDEGGVNLHWTYDVSLFSQQHIEQLNDHFCRLLTGLCEAPDTTSQPLHALPILSQQEVDYLVTELNDTAKPYDSEKCLHELFSEQAACHPGEVALVFKDTSMTWQQLNERSNQLAHYLKDKHQVSPDTLVGLCVERSAEMVVAILGILKAGGAYVPLDPTSPRERMHYILEDAALDLVLSEKQLQASLADFSANIITIDGIADINCDMHICRECKTDNLSPVAGGLTSANLAYVIYTSGSTGKPKGVMTEHRAVMNFGAGFCEQIRGREVLLKNGWLWLSSFVFDASLKGIYLLATGTKLIIPSSDEIKSPEKIVALINHHQLRVINATPQLLQLIVKTPDLKNVHLISSGEAIGINNFNTFQQFAKQAGSSFINAYGPTESTINSSFANLCDARSENIGKPVANTSFYILDENRALTPFGCVGELYIAGEGLARGYLNQPELTTERFIQNPFYQASKPQSSTRLYRTGDLVRYLADGNIEFVGRSDDQVKIRGFRIELAEVEAQLSLLGYVDSAVVMAKTVAGSLQLVAWVKLSRTEVATQASDAVSRIKSELRASLPEYMIPGFIVLLESWPLTAGGKLDRASLPEPHADMLKGEYLAPVTSTQEKLVGIWADLLKLPDESISRNADFFDVGGHSLLCIRLVSKIRSCFGVEVAIQSIFDNPCLEDMAAIIQDGTRSMRPALPTSQDLGNRLPVSFAQQRLWFIDNLQGGSPEYNIPLAFEVLGKLDMSLVSEIFKTIIQRHQILRTVYIVQNGETLQHIIADTDIAFDIAVDDISHLRTEELENQVKTIFETEIARPFDLSKELMLRVRYVCKGSDNGVVILNMHHIASDGWSIDVLTREFFTLYEAYSLGKENPLPDLAVQYAGYAQWQREYLTGKVLDAQMSYWEKQLDELPAVHSVPLDFARPQVKQHKGASVTGQLPASTATRLLALAKQHKLTPFMLLHGALALMLSRHSSSCDIVVGTPVANRVQAELEPLIGFFVNTLVLRANTRQASLSNYFAHIRQVHLDAQSNQDVPFEQLVERLKVPRSAAHSPLFQIMMSTSTDYGLSDKTTAMAIPGADVKPYRSTVIQAKFDLEVDLSIAEHGVDLNWIYDIELFSSQHIEQLNEHLCRLLSGFCDIVDPTSAALHELPLLSPQETRYLVKDLNNTARDYAKDKCIHQLFEQQAVEHPNEIALVFESESLSYQQLNAKASQLACYLTTQHDITPDTLVGLCTERSLEMVIAILGILKAGAAYVPIDPSYPKDRLDFILQDAAPELVLTQSQVQSVFAEFAGTIVTLDSLLIVDNHLDSTFDKLDSDAINTGVTASNLAYVIYTSGSTGNPKGVLIEHRSVNNLIHAQKENYQLGARGPEVGLLLASYAFDASVEQMFLMLLTGNTLVIPSKASLLDPSKLAAMIMRHSVTHIDSTPSHLVSLQACLTHKTVHRVISGGEAMIPQLAELIAPDTPLYNVYGPTEACVTSCVSSADSSIGRPLNNTELFVVDKSLALVPDGTAGELLIGGDGLARGYLNLPELTQTRFIQNPFYDRNKQGSSERLYRTGDLVRYLPNGNLEFIGRIDEQVSIRGFRVEPGEVEAQLTQLDTVDSALVMARETAGGMQLVGYVKPAINLNESDRADYTAEIKAKLTQYLPDYMVPTVLITVTQWPMTPSDKIDRKALPEPDITELQANYVAATTETEQALVSIWANVLNLDVDDISTAVSFFELGGHSLLMVKLLSLIQTRLQKPCELSALFSATTIQAQARHLDTLQYGLNNTELLQPITHHLDAQESIIFIPGVASTAKDFQHIIAHLKTSKPDAAIGVFRHKGLIATEDYFTSIEANVAAFSECLGNLTDKTITLVGHSYGGALALALAEVLQSNGVRLALMMVDTYFEQKRWQAEIAQQDHHNRDFRELDVPEYLIELYQHQINLFDDYIPFTQHKYPMMAVLAQQSPFDQHSYRQYLENKFCHHKTEYQSVEGDHFSMLQGKSAKSISDLILAMVNEIKE